MIGGGDQQPVEIGLDRGPRRVLPAPPGCDVGQQQVFAEVRNRSKEDLDALETLEVAADTDVEG